MTKYKIIVTDCGYNKSSYEWLKQMNGYFESPIVDLNFENNQDKAMDEFENMFKKYYQHFFKAKYEVFAIED